VIHPYASETYANAFREIAASVFLKSSRTWVLKRRIPGTDLYDAMGCYPLCAIEPSADLEADFVDLRSQGLVSLVLVTDTFFRPDVSRLQEAFDVCKPFKKHYLYDPRAPFAYGKHHRYEVKKAAADCETRVVPFEKHFQEWLALYGYLIRERGIAGIQNFPESYFRGLVGLDGLIAIAAFVEGKAVSMYLWIEHEGYVYSHLGASSEEGYRMRAAYAIYDHAIRLFGDRKVMDFGGGVGLEDTPDDGLAAFKNGFSNRTETCFLCGKILDEKTYQELSRRYQNSSFFPAYRTL
jgi:hypothetical protein